MVYVSLGSDHISLPRKVRTTDLHAVSMEINQSINPESRVPFKRKRKPPINPHLSSSILTSIFCSSTSKHNNGFCQALSPAFSSVSHLLLGHPSHLDKRRKHRGPDQQNLSFGGGVRFLQTNLHGKPAVPKSGHC
jgi:hypothetical protein